MCHMEITQADAHVEPLRMCRPNEVCRLLGVSPATLARLRKSGEFPAPRRLGRRSVAWIDADVRRWMATRPAA
jgi:predicted DNA-binding transcriptional regulator AlpA